MRPWQRDILDGIFELRADGKRRYRRGLLGMPRKNGKSLLGAIIALYGLVSDGEMGAEVYSCAGEKEQARIVFGEAKRIVEMEPELSRRLRIFRDAIEDKETGSVYRVLSANHSSLGAWAANARRTRSSWTGSPGLDLRPLLRARTDKMPCALHRRWTRFSDAVMPRSAASSSAMKR